MTIGGITSSSLMNSLLQATTATKQSATDTSSASPAQSDPAYVLSLGQQRSQGALLGYGQLGQLVNQAESSLASMDQRDPNLSVKLGNGTQLTETHSVDVRQLAQAQVVTSRGFAAANQAVIATGTLSIQTGSYDTAANSFTAAGDPVSVAISDGSLNGVAAAINAAGAGLTASVVQAADGQYELQVTGQTGVANAFQLSGIDALSYDPAAPTFSGLQDTQFAQDAQYAVDGGTMQTSSTNTVSIGNSLSATLTATGTMSVSVPFGFSQTLGAANTLADSVNSLLSGLGGLTGSGEQLAGDTGPASTLGKALGQALTQTFPGSEATLAGVGITVQSDGTLAVDQAKLQAAYTSDPTGTRSLLDKAATAVKQTLGGSDDQIKGQLQDLVTAMIAQGPSLAEVLGQDNTSADASSLAGGMFNQNDALLGLFGDGSSQSQTSSLSDILAQMSSGTSDTSGTDTTADTSLAAALQSLSASSSGG
ncbi:MAG TPA: flagellar filament capping protein FliD [Magnetospirillum sp.]|jgi:flagellar hook-associated protein 2|nr:flagellar filament capping protein FliD [Magnetospirillum sp.]